MSTDQAHGAFNVSAPRPATNRELTHALAAVLHRPAFAPVPGFAIRALFGNMGEQLILNGNNRVRLRVQAQSPDCGSWSDWLVSRYP